MAKLNTDNIVKVYDNNQTLISKQSFSNPDLAYTYYLETVKELMHSKKYGYMVCRYRWGSIMSISEIKAGA